MWPTIQLVQVPSDAHSEATRPPWDLSPLSAQTPQAQEEHPLLPLPMVAALLKASRYHKDSHDYWGRRGTS